MKKMIAMLIAVLMLVMSIPQNVYASRQITPSGISYDDIDSEMCNIDYRRGERDGL